MSRHTLTVGLLVALAAAGAWADAAQDEAVKNDIDKLRDFAALMSNPQVLRSDPAKAVDLVQQLPAIEKEHQRIKQQHAALLGGSDPAGRPLKTMLAHFERQREGFLPQLDQVKASLPGDVEKDLAEAERMAQQAVTEKRPLWFTAGIPQRLGWAESKLKVLTALDAEAAKPLADRLNKGRTAVREQEAKLKDDIIAGNRMPPDKYAGPDKAELVGKVTAAWKEKYPQDKVLAVRIPGTAWARETGWRWNGSEFNKMDASRLQAQVVVQSDDKLATVYVVNLVKDHLKQDQVGKKLDDKKDVPVQNQLLVQNAK